MNCTLHLYVYLSSCHLMWLNISIICVQMCHVLQYLCDCQVRPPDRGGGGLLRWLCGLSPRQPAVSLQRGDAGAQHVCSSHRQEDQRVQITSTGAGRKSAEVKFRLGKGTEEQQRKTHVVGDTLNKEAKIKNIFYIFTLNAYISSSFLPFNVTFCAALALTAHGDICYFNAAA